MGRVYGPWGSLPRDTDDTLLGFTKVLRDRSAQRQAEEDLRDEYHALETLNRSTSALALEQDRQKAVQIVTDAGVALTGAEFGAFFYNVNQRGGRELLALHLVRRAGRVLLQICDAAQYCRVRPDI